MNKSKFSLIAVGITGWFIFINNPVQAHQKYRIDKPAEKARDLTLEERVAALEGVEKKHRHFWKVKGHSDTMSDYLKGFQITGQMTGIYQTSDLNLKSGDLASGTDLKDYQHKDGTGSFSTDLFIEKEFDHSYFLLNIEFANGAGVDAPLQGGGMVNNDIMEDESNHNHAYIAHAYYEHTFTVHEGYNLVFDLGKFGVPDFFDEGYRVADQTVQFLNQAITNNGAFDYVQDLQGHGYTYGTRSSFETPWIDVSGAAFSSDSYLDNLSDKYSLIGQVEVHFDFTKEIRGCYRAYVFKNFGEYARFDNDGNLITKDTTSDRELINTADNPDDLDKGGFGISMDQSLPWGINLFGKYGQQDDDRDVRHYQDMDRSIMFGFDVSGKNWKRKDDVLGAAYEIGQLTGNHRKAHKKGYVSFFDRPGLGKGAYADERVLEIYYKIGLNDYLSLSLDYQMIDNFFYSKRIDIVQLWATRMNVSF